MYKHLCLFLFCLPTVWAALPEHIHAIDLSSKSQTTLTIKHGLNLLNVKGLSKHDYHCSLTPNNYTLEGAVQVLGESTAKVIQPRRGYHIHLQGIDFIVLKAHDGGHVELSVELGVFVDKTLHVDMICLPFHDKKNPLLQMECKLRLSDNVVPESIGQPLYRQKMRSALWLEMIAQDHSKQSEGYNAIMKSYYDHIYGNKESDIPLNISGAFKRFFTFYVEVESLLEHYELEPMEKKAIKALICECIELKYKHQSLLSFFKIEYPLVAKRIVHILKMLNEI